MLQMHLRSSHESSLGLPALASAQAVTRAIAKRSPNRVRSHRSAAVKLSLWGLRIICLHFRGP
jgi:hypothetical protein